MRFDRKWYEKARCEAGSSEQRPEAFSLHKNIYFMGWEKNYYNAIVLLKNGTALKYHTIRRDRLPRFHEYVRKKFSGVDHINYYPVGGGKCVEQVRFAV